jgi:predicted transcriptional regulator
MLKTSKKDLRPDGPRSIFCSTNNEEPESKGRAMKTNVGSWMTRHPLKIDKYEDIDTATDMMRRECISHLLVFDSGWLSGVLSDTDLQLVDRVKAKFGFREIPVQITVGDLMSRQPLTISEDVSMVEAIQVMKEKRIRSLPVVNAQNIVIGIVTQTDVMRYALVASQNLERHGSFSKIMGG